MISEVWTFVEVEMSGLSYSSYVRTDDRWAAIKRAADEFHRGEMRAVSGIHAEPCPAHDDPGWPVLDLAKEKVE